MRSRPQDWDATSPDLPFDVVLTCYTLFERGKDYGKDRTFLSKWAWSHLVMDEAHGLKNRNSTRSRKLRMVAKSCKHRIMLTGGWGQRPCTNTGWLGHQHRPTVLIIILKASCSDSMLDIQVSMVYVVCIS